MRRQYLTLKSQHPDAILFFRLGDFYETFDQDAETCARVLQITLTAREIGRGQRVPMAGVPAHAVQGYLARMVQAGFKVAVCEQVGDTEAAGSGARAMMTREVTRVVTAGTVIEPSMLDGRRNNYLVSVVASSAIDGRNVKRGTPDEGARALSWGLAYADITTGEFGCAQLDGDDGAEAGREIARLDPAECIIPAVGRFSRVDDEAPTVEAIACAERRISFLEPLQFDLATARASLHRVLAVASLVGFGCEDRPMAIRAAGALVAYLEQTHRSRLPLLDGLVTYDPSVYLRLDPYSRRNRDLDDDGSTGARGSGPARVTLARVLDEARTPVGSRLLRRWLGQPLCDAQLIVRRHDAVEGFVRDAARREMVRTVLGNVSDIERLAGRASQRLASPRDLIAIRSSLIASAEIARTPASGTISGTVADLAIGSVIMEIDACEDIVDLIGRAVQVEEPSTGARSRSGPGVSLDDVVGGKTARSLQTVGGERIIQRGYSDELDELIAESQSSRNWIARLEGAERDRTGIRTLRVGFNRVFGYYLHVPNSYRGPVPDGYTRRQTLADGERFTTPELNEHEAKVLSAAEAIDALQRRLFDAIQDTVAAETSRLRATANALATIDALSTFATVAVKRGYVRPEIDETGGLELLGARHPVVEVAVSDSASGGYVPNDCVLDAAGGWMTILTGPNMAGKSTYLRSVALIVLMAQAGSFVPATVARIGLVDRIFTRVGAHDDLVAGRSTFMVEMVEAAQILRHATPRSLVVLDELGRGTSTHDGLAIAQAVAEYLHGTAESGGRPRTLFATHYHELADLDQSLDGVANARMDVLEKGDRVVFLHRVVSGAAGRSYGIHVARLAGMPKRVTERATELLAHLETRATRPSGTSMDDFSGVGGASGGASLGRRRSRTVTGDVIKVGAMQLTMFAPEVDIVRGALDQIDVDTLTPLEALNELSRLKRLAQNLP